MAFYDQLLKLRKKWDLFPWAEAATAIVPLNSAIGTRPLLRIKPTHPMFVSELTFCAVNNGDANGLFVPLTFDLQWQLGSAQPTPMVDRAFIASALLGRPGTDWHKAGAGLLLEEAEELDFQPSILDAIGAGDGFGGSYGGEIAIVARGYRLWSRRIISPAQLTRDEHAAAGRKLQNFPVGTRVALAANTTKVSVEYQFKTDFLVSKIAIAANGNGDDQTETDMGKSSLIHVEIKPPRQLMNEAVNRFALVGAAPRTVWNFPIPITVKKGEKWSIAAQHMLAPGAGTTLDVVLHGERIIR